MKLKPAALVALIGVLAATWGVGALAIDYARRPSSVWQEKIAGAERLVYYRLTEGRGVDFQLQAGESRVRLVSHCEVGKNLVYEPRRSVIFGLRLKLVGPDKRIVWAHDLYAKGRQSKAERRDGAWLVENAFVTDGVTEISDDRLFDVDLPEAVTAGSVLTVEKLGAPPEVLVRAYRAMPRDARIRSLKTDSLPAWTQERLAARISFVPWHQLRQHDQHELLGWNHQRLSAVGESDADYQTRVVYYSGFRIPESEADPTAYVQTHHALAFDVRGAARVTVRTWCDEEDPDPDRTCREPIVLDTLAGATAGPSRALPPPPGRTVTVATVELPVGVETLHLRSKSARRVHVELSAAPGGPVQFGSHALLPHPDGQRIVADERELGAYLFEPGDSPVVSTIERTSSPESHLLKIETRALPNVDGRLPAELMVSAVVFDELNKVTQTISVPIRPVVAPFERPRLSRPFALAASVQDARGIDDMVSEPVSFRMVLPSAGRVEVKTSTRTLVRLQTLMPNARERLEQPYRDVGLEGHYWRYAPHELRMWAPVRAENHVPLAEQGRLAKIIAQVRMQPRTTAIAAVSPTWVGVPLEPRGSTARQYVVEAAAPQTLPTTLRDWQGGTYTRMVAGRDIALDFGRRAALTPELRWDVPGDRRSAVGTSFEVFLDGASLGQVRLSASAGSWKFPRALVGPHSVRVAGLEEGVIVLVDQPPVSGGDAEIVQIRTVHDLAASPVRLIVDHRPSEKLFINVVVYAATLAADPGTVVDVVVDGGNPSRTKGAAFESITLARRSIELPPATRQVAAHLERPSGPVIGYPRVLGVSLGPDLSAGAHTIELRARGRGPLWARFFVMRPFRPHRDVATTQTFDASQVPGETVGGGDSE